MEPPTPSLAGPDPVTPDEPGVAPRDVPGDPVRLDRAPTEAVGDGDRPPVWRTLGIVLAAVALVAAAVWVVPNLAGTNGSAPQPSASIVPSSAAVASAGPAASPSATPALSLSPAVAGPALSLPAGRSLGASGSIVIVGTDGSLSLVDSKGQTLVLQPPGDATFAFPAWSPDGSKLAAIRIDATGTAILVFDARALAGGERIAPRVIFRSATISPFYAAWTPDSRAVSFLADEADELWLRVAPADGSAPLDGTGPGAKIRSGNPFYFDWIGNDRLLAHVGSGADAFLGEIGLDGAPAGPALGAPGDFRPAVVNHDGTLISYVRAAQTGPAHVVVSHRDGTNERTMPVFGSAGVTFDPTGDTVASIGPAVDGGQPFTIPIGPLRLLDPSSGKVRTLLDGTVVSFWWSPDARTIAALRVQPIAGASGGGSGSGGSAASASPLASAGAAATPPTPSPVASIAASLQPVPSVPVGSSAAPAGSTAPSPSASTSEVRLLFVDVASGHVEAQSVVEPGQVFIDQFLVYFDQYALSHQLWAPDSSSLLLPIADPDGTTHVNVMSRDGKPPIRIDGTIGLWSP